MKNDQSDFGAPKIDNTPTGQVDMYGQLFGGISRSQKPTWVKIVSILFCLAFLIIPGAFLLFVSIAGYGENGFIGILIPLFIGLVLTLSGLSGVVINTKRSK